MWCLIVGVLDLQLLSRDQEILQHIFALHPQHRLLSGPVYSDSLLQARSLEVGLAEG